MLGRSATTLLLALSVLGCAADNQARMDDQRVQRQSDLMVASAKEFTAKLQAQGEAYIADYARRLESYRPLLREYYACNRNAARIVSTQAGDSTSLAIAARSICRSEEAKLQRAVYAVYTDNPRFGMDAMEKFRAAVLENNTGEIVAARAAVQSRPPAPARPKTEQAI